MAVPFNDLKRRFSPQREVLAAEVSEILAGGQLIGGPVVQDFEDRFARYCGADHCIGVANGTDALELGLKACGVSPGDEVVTVANAGGYATTAIMAIGATPIYTEIQASDLQIDPAKLPQVLTSRTKAIVVTHLFGQMNDVAAIRSSLARLDRADVQILEDCAQAHGAQRGGRAGSLGDVAALSFYPTKNLGAIGDDGALVTSRKAIAERARQLQQYGWSGKYRTEVKGGRNSRMDPVQAASLRVQLPQLDAWNARRQVICQHYAASLRPGFAMVFSSDATFVGHLAVVIASDEASRNRLRQSLIEKEIGSDIHYPILDCDQPGWQDVSPRRPDLPVSRLMLTRILSVPCFPELADAEVERVGNVLRG